MWRGSWWKTANSSYDAMRLSVCLLGRKKGGEEDEEGGDPYAKWRRRFSRSLLEQMESTVRELRLKDKEGRRENTFAKLRCCSDLCSEKTEGENIERVFISTEGLNERLNGGLTNR
jgi:hypothetical protein